MVPSILSNPRLPGSVTRIFARSLVVVTICGLLLAAGTGAAAADGGGQGLACPGENPNVGYENANLKGAFSSLSGIGKAFTVIGCHEVADAQI